MAHPTQSSSQSVPGAPPLWGGDRRALRVQVFGAGGAVGREIACSLLAEGHPPKQLALFGRRSKQFSWRGMRLVMNPIRPPLPEAELAFVCTPGELARRLVPILVQRGTHVIDLSGAHADVRDVPLVLPNINPQELGAFTPVVALPNRSAVLIAHPLWALEQAAGIEAIRCTVLRSVASDGVRGILSLRGELRGRYGPKTGQGARWGRVGNVFPAASPMTPGGGAVLEESIQRDLLRILGRRDLACDIMAVQVDAERCDGFSVQVELQRPLIPGEALRLFSSAPGVAIVPEGVGPSPATCAGSNLVQVGRIRSGSGGPRSLCFFAVGDQLRMGGAIPALQAASRLPL